MEVLPLLREVIRECSDPVISCVTLLARGRCLQPYFEIHSHPISVAWPEIYEKLGMGWGDVFIDNALVSI